MTNYKTVRFYSPLALLGLAACGSGNSGGVGGGLPEYLTSMATW